MTNQERRAFISIRSYYFQTGLINCRSDHVSFDMARAIWIGATAMATRLIDNGVFNSSNAKIYVPIKY